MSIHFRPLAIAVVSTLSFMISGCISMYRNDIAQGNYITQAQVDQLKLGMTKEQVRFVMGTPLLIDPFRPDRWEYVFTFQQANANTRTVRGVTVQFEQDRIAKVEATALVPKDDSTDKALPRINEETLTK